MKIKTRTKTDEWAPWIKLAASSWTDKLHALNQCLNTEDKKIFVLCLEVAFFHPTRGPDRGRDILGMSNLLCQMYPEPGCQGCPIKMNGLTCYRPKHPYIIWKAKKPSWEQALDEYYQHICKQYAKAYDKKFRKEK